MNERTRFFIKKKIISHTLFSKGWCFMCVSDELETGTDCYIDPAVLLSHPGCAAQPWVTEAPKPSVCRWLSTWHLISNWLEPSGTWLYYCLTSTCFRLFTLVHLSIDVSVERKYNKYITLLPEFIKNSLRHFCTVRIQIILKSK